ncbi:MAG TPA: MotA/TolQ/ExbB proton channel family protein [Bdellovibrionota bacterium]|nr:MotA/TolQ/ExbB proton channel family protein [Bdellovibrionota bacterium]
MSLFEFLKGNFFHVAPILVVGAIAAAIILERTWALVYHYPMKHVPQFFDKLRDLVMADKLAEAISLCDRYKTKPVAHVVREALLRAHQPEPLIQDGLEIAVSEASEQIQKRTSYLSSIANVATLLGLLGTIVGLIKSFEAVGSAAAQQRSALLAEGISTAMNATMLGLAVAIPCMIAYSFLINRTNRLNAEVDRSAVRILDLINQRFYSADDHGKSGIQKAV